MFVASRTRPDILYAVTFLSQFNNRHSRKHVSSLLQTLQYVVNTQDYCIDLSFCKDEKLCLFSDASWATDLDECKSFGGYIIYLGGTVIGWGCKKQTTVATSSMESEYIALTYAVKEAYWISNLFESCLLFDYVNVPTIHSDSISSIQFATNDLENSKTKHIRIKYWFLRDWFEKGYFKLNKVPGQVNIADIFTKFLSSEKISELCKTVFNRLSRK
uniref:Copia protein n=1 Tax=Strigamia maritima TaxID=126957 RepID=T1IQ60_STRMM